MEMCTLKKEILEGKNVKKKMSKAQMQLAIIKKKQCDAKALTIIEQLLEPKIDSQWLLYNLRYINRSHMEDVIEERAIIKLCGYVLCNNALTTTINQRYHISTKKNKVYDITRRKNFCSSCCYGACNYILEQMLTSPLWLRDKEEIPEFKILKTIDELNKNTIGDEIYLTDVQMVLNPKNIDEHIETNEIGKNSKNVSFSKCPEINMYNEYIIKNNENMQRSNIIKKPNVCTEFPKDIHAEFKDMKNESVNLKNEDTISEECLKDNNVKKIPIVGNNILLNNTVIQDNKIVNKNAIGLREDKNQNIKSTEQNNLFELSETEHNIAITKQNIIISNKDLAHKIKQNKCEDYKHKSSIKKKQSNEFYNLAMHIEHNIREWITKDTISLLSGEEDIKNQLLENIVQHDKYLHLCKKLNKLQLEDEKDDHISLTTNSLRPLPHLSTLQEEGKKMELKVRAFYKGSMVIENNKNDSEVAEQDNNFTPVLPLTETHAPKMLRRRIFLDKLGRILPDLLCALASNKLPQYTYSSEKSTLIKVLINTFSLSAANVIFKTTEWTLVGLIIIKMLSMIDYELKVLLATKQASMYISMILMSYKLDSNYLDRLVMELINNTDISNIDNAVNIHVI
ncbi:PREDICTED: putative RNA polymerase II subunit B1 CTD phosphatase Rpap2 [Eufriesea mexicana]|uniref:putative RNA polymerase II subunit B1 CTD phosphatase Rpap2 n=1 Tax=Eufriesea mexicana TaxID=516756 RepID=UPI00083C70ED|nr:PREDICTED: putative RNA polymerase II subunit B1 CTD phosphatase Rpap2 [Eufriesea mexicana]